MLEMMDSCSMSESVETLSGDVSEPNETARGSNGPAFENVMDFTKKINSSTSSLTSPVDSGVVLLDEVEPSTDTKKEPHVCAIQGVEAVEPTSQSTPVSGATTEQVTGDDEIVFQRRTRKKVLKDIKSKRVSFHEDVNTLDAAENKDIKINVGLTDRVSADILTPTEQGQDLNSSLVLSSNFTEPVFSIEKMFSKLKNSVLTLAERGVPEGQEDPLNCSSYIEFDSSLSFGSKHLTQTKASESDRTTRLKSPAVRNVLSEAPSKAPLVNRFLLSLQMKESRKKHASLNRRHQIRGIKSHRPLIVKVKPYNINLKSFEHVLNELNDEISVNLCNRLETNWQKDVEERLETHLFKGKEVKIHKVFRVLSTIGEPLLTILTDTSLLVIAYDQNELVIRFSITYSNIKIIMVGPGNLTLMFIEQYPFGHSHFTIVTDNENLHGGNDLISHLEVIVRQKKCPTIPVLSSSIHEDKKFLKKTSIEANEETTYCQWIWLQQIFASDAYALGPMREGYLMYRQTKRTKWAPSFILLKASVIYVFTDSNLKIPIHVIHLKTKKFKGARKFPDSRQPHAFEVLFDPDISVQFGAASEEDLFEWLDAVSLSTFGAEDCQVVAKRHLDPVIGCCLLLTTKHIVMYQLPCEVLSCLLLTTLNVVKFSSTHSYCVLEFDCCEANETNGDWVIHFSSEQGLNKFYNVLSSVLPNLHQITDRIDVTSDFAIRCMERNNSLKNVWSCFL
ncbi:uncharacterized protein prd1 [Bemisia tabaci]|uniref:uncharacterized protein prd1 n=1 Tax=Bemisia tabaci TaxID=7038 RepID=UPI003B28A40B